MNTTELRRRRRALGANYRCEDCGHRLVLNRLTNVWSDCPDHPEGRHVDMGQSIGRTGIETCLWYLDRLKVRHDGLLTTGATTLWTKPTAEQLEAWCAAAEPYEAELRDGGTDTRWRFPDATGILGCSALSTLPGADPDNMRIAAALWLRWGCGAPERVMPAFTVNPASAVLL